MTHIAGLSRHLFSPSKPRINSAMLVFPAAGLRDAFRDSLMQIRPLMLESTRCYFLIVCLVSVVVVGRSNCFSGFRALLVRGARGGLCWVCVFI